MKKITKIIISIIITVVLIAFLLSQINITDLFLILSKTQLHALLLGFILYLVSYILRTLRFKILFKNEISFRDFFSIVSVYNMITSTLPMRTGEFSFVYLLKRRNVSGTRAIAILFFCRVFDIIVISLLFIISLHFVKTLADSIKNANLIIIPFLVSLILILMFLMFFGKKFILYFKKTIKFLRLNNIRLVVYVLSKTDKTIGNFRSLRNLRNISQTIIFSILIWLSQAFMVYVLLNYSGITINFWSALSILTISGFTFLLPIQGISNFGTLEGVWTLVFISLGASTTVAISSSFALHLIIILYYVILGLFGLTQIKKFKIKEAIKS